MNRTEALNALRARPDVSVLIVGGGINGIGAFRDLALNKIDVLLVDRGDFCSGASAASSHMAHGGIRYLENGEFRLVREAVQERNRLLLNAPHVVRPLPTTIPIFKLFSGLLNAPLKFLGLLDRPAERGALVIKLGLLLYDAYTGHRRVVPRHCFLNRQESTGQWPDLNRSVAYTATYYDGAILQPERLGLELILDAEADHSEASAINYMSLTGARGSDVSLRDEVTGQEYVVRPRLVINAAGPWIDQANAELGAATRFIGGTKGSHLVLNNPRLRQAIGEHEFFFENKDGRIVLIFPLYDRVLVGTSDTPISDPDTATCTNEEIDYFLAMVERVFPSIQVRREDIVFQFSGVRPLPASTSRTTGQISRDHEIRVLDPAETGRMFPIYSLVGGKWTSYRAFAEQVVDRGLAYLGRARIADTKELPIGGGRSYPGSEVAEIRAVMDLAARTKLPRERIQALYERYGTRVAGYVSYIAQGPDAPLQSVEGYSAAEIAFMAAAEKVVRLDDILLRRSMLAMLGRVTRQGVEELARAAAVSLQWSEAEIRTEVQRAIDLLRERHHVAL